MYLVTGATGNVGSALVGELMASGEPVRAVVRRPDADLPEGVERVLGDLNEPDGWAAALDGVRGMFLMPGYDGLPRLLDLARAARVERVVLMTGGSAALEDLDNAVSRYMTLSERAVRASDLAWTFLRPRAFMSNALRWLPQLRAGDIVRLQFPGVATACVDPADIAAVAARALVETGHEGRVHEVTGPESLLPAEQVAVLAEVLGRDLQAVGLSDEETRAAMEADGTPPEYVAAFFDFYVGGTLDESVVKPDVPRVLGRPARTFSQWATDHADAFR